MNIIDQAILAHLKTIPNIATCTEYAGQFDATQAKQVSFTAPALFLVALGGREAQDPMTGQVQLTNRYTVFVVCKSGRGRNARKTDAQLLCERVLLLARQNDWGLDCVYPTANLRFENLYTPQTDTKGLALWSVSWEQDVLLGQEEQDWDELNVPITTVFLGMAPDIGPGHEADYTEIAITQAAPSELP